MKKKSKKVPKPQRPRSNYYKHEGIFWYELPKPRRDVKSNFSIEEGIINGIF